MQSQKALNATTTHLRLKPDGMMEKLPVGDDFWQRLMGGELGNFHHEYLVTTSSFDAGWESWEIHPNGDEIVLLLSGSVDLLLETDDGVVTVEARQPGDYAFVPKGTWHTADAHAPSMMLFITAGEGTQVRPRTS